MNRIGLGFNPIFTVDKMVDLAVSAEKNGFESFWVHESIHQRDAVSYLSSILSKTKKLKVGTGCINTVTRHPSLAATTFATLAEIYPKRIIMGIGWGGFPFLPKIGYNPFPTSQSKPLKRVTEYVSIVNSLLTGENITFTGEFFTVNNMSLEIELKYKIPIYIASLSPKLLKRSSTLADGVILSPGPGDPELLDRSVTTAKELADMLPIMGICLGHQVIARAFGARTFKLHFGHRGGNQPVKDLQTGRVYVTAQNHGYAVDPEGLPEEIEISHINLNDNTVEGLRHKDLPIMTIQYHSEASPGPHDSEYLFDRFMNLVQSNVVVEV